MIRRFAIAWLPGTANWAGLQSVNKRMITAVAKGGIASMEASLWAN
jgi:hypothetical protein